MPKTYKHLYEQVTGFSALLAAYERARKGKRYRPDVLEFSARLGENLLGLQHELRSMAWRPGAYRTLVVQEKKRRQIHIAPFRDRVVHQALCAVFAPLFEETFISDSYACRLGKGTHAALDRLTAFLRKSDAAFVLSGDFSQFFSSIPHGLVMREVEWRIMDARMIETLERVLASFESEFRGNDGFAPRGLPIGNLTSQWFANMVGNCLDQHVKHELKCKRYIRYMDNWLLLSDSKEELRGWLGEIERLSAEIGLVINPKTQIIKTADGVPFLGFRVWSDHRKVLRENVTRGRRRLRAQLRQVAAGTKAPEVAMEELRSWFAHLEHGDTYRLRRSLWQTAKPTLGGATCS